MKFPLNEMVYVDTNGNWDFYIKHCEREWYVKAYPAGTMDVTKRSMAGFDRKRDALKCVEAWKSWMK